MPGNLGHIYRIGTSSKFKRLYIMDNLDRENTAFAKIGIYSLQEEGEYKFLMRSTVMNLTPNPYKLTVNMWTHRHGMICRFHENIM